MRTEAFAIDRAVSIHLPGLYGNEAWNIVDAGEALRSQKIMQSQRILALDVGDRRIGLAITDPLGLTAQPLFTLHRTTLRADLKAIARFIRQHQVTTVVVGNPLHADGTPGAQAAKAEAFAKALEAEHPTLAHHLLDERLTTRDAHELLDLAGRSPRSAGPGARVSRTEIIDQVAAVLLLESFLSLHSGPSLLPDPGDTAT